MRQDLGMHMRWSKAVFAIGGVLLVAGAIGPWFAGPSNGVDRGGGYLLVFWSNDVHGWVLAMGAASALTGLLVHPRFPRPGQIAIAVAALVATGFIVNGFLDATRPLETPGLPITDTSNPVQPDWGLYLSAVAAGTLLIAPAASARLDRLLTG